MSACLPSSPLPPAVQPTLLRDTRGRALRDLRISVTDRCNFRCTYCMPKEVFGKDHVYLPRSALLDFEEITRANIDEVWEMSRKWAEMMDTGDDQSLHEELSALEETFRHFEALNMQGGLIRANGRVIAFSIGDPLNDDVYLVQFEKAYPDIPGAYQVINQQFAEHYVAGYKFANREDDAGDEGLRKAKLSYDPIFLVAKYSARQITP